MVNPNACRNDKYGGKYCPVSYGKHAVHDLWKLMRSYMLSSHGLVVTGNVDPG